MVPGVKQRVARNLVAGVGPTVDGMIEGCGRVTLGLCSVTEFLKTHTWMPCLQSPTGLP